MTYAQNWKDFPDYIIGITKEIWEGRGVETLNRYYSPKTYPCVRQWAFSGAIRR